MSLPPFLGSLENLIRNEGVQYLHMLERAGSWKENNNSYFMIYTTANIILNKWNKGRAGLVFAEQPRDSCKR